MPKDNITNILVVGIGGQGVMTAAEILAEAAISQGHDVKKTEVAGMAQRGGVVSSHVRFGPQVLSPVVAPGTADFILGFEAAEAMRWAPQLREGGTVFVNTLRLVPPVVSIGLYDYPEDPVVQTREMGIETYDFDAGAIATELGNIKLVNTIMLGAVSDQLPFKADILKDAVLKRFRQRKPKLVEVNEQAFDRGREMILSFSYAPRR
uniref:Indolepyruvate oxidoreductase subunit iorB n=1 Tax=Magnetococcus massalia (strain MO-1) TaxID=451514 RepID=A0A1S7LE65_MAGMO|nr:Indolepyruvate oxidoreductase subunit iorB [Candidatus Magnetococcus massalia]